MSCSRTVYVDSFVQSYLFSMISAEESQIIQEMSDLRLSIGSDPGDGDDHSSISHICQESCSYPHAVICISGLVTQSDGTTVRRYIEIDAEDFSISDLLEGFEEYLGQLLI